MRAAIIHEPNHISVEEKALPEIRDGKDVLVRVKMTGICGSDMHIYAGKNPFATYPRVWGHEYCGEVVELGSEVTTLQPGDHVVAEPIEYCGKCYACRKGRPNVCQELKVRGVHIDGGCTEYIVMREDRLHKVSNTIPWRCAVLTEPLTIGLQAVSRARVSTGDYVLIMGTGTIGLTCLIAAKKKGAICIMTDLFDEKLSYAKKYGADYTINVREKNLPEELKTITGGMGPNVIIDGVCSSKSLEEAVEMVSTAGRIVEMGFASITSAICHKSIMGKEVDVLGTRLQANKFPEAVSLMEEKAELLEDFVTQEFPLEKVEEAMNFAIHNGSVMRKVVVMM